MTEMTNEELRYKSLAIIQAIDEAHDKLYVVEHKRDGVWRLHLDMNISTIEAQSIMAMQELRRKWPAAEWRVSVYIPSLPASSGVPQPTINWPEPQEDPGPYETGYNHALEDCKLAFAAATPSTGEVDVEPLPAQPKEALRGKVVRVDNEKFNGFGYAIYESGPRKPIVSVLLENGNEWDYDAETVRLATPEEIRLAPKVVQSDEPQEAKKNSRDCRARKE